MQLLSRNPCTCEYYAHAPAHHDQLMALERADFGALTDMLEFAATWDELDYSGQRLIAPSEWLTFATGHEWDDPERVVDFVLAIQSFVRPQLVIDLAHLAAVPLGEALEAHA